MSEQTQPDTEYETKSEIVHNADGTSTLKFNFWVTLFERVSPLEKEDKR